MSDEDRQKPKLKPFRPPDIHPDDLWFEGEDRADPPLPPEPERAEEENPMSLIESLRGAVKAEPPAPEAPPSGLRLLPTPEPGEAVISLEAAVLSPAAQGAAMGAMGAAGRIVALGEGAEDLPGLSAGRRVALLAAQPCGICGACLSGAPTRCAAPQGIEAPHLSDPAPEAGAPRAITLPAARCAAVGEAAPGAAALLQPLAAALHALDRAGPALGRETMVFGEGPLAAALVFALRAAGAARIAALASGAAAAETLRLAGADEAIDAAEEAAAAEALRAGARYDLCFDATGEPAALAVALAALRPGGALILAVEGEGAASLSGFASRGLSVIGAAASAPDHARALALLRAGRADGLEAAAASFPTERLSDALRHLGRGEGPALLLW